MSIEAMRKALNYIENTEGELGIKLSCGDALREALAAQQPAAPVGISDGAIYAAVSKRDITPEERRLIERSILDASAVLYPLEPVQSCSAATVQVRPLEWDEGKGELAGQLVWSSGDPWVFWIVKNPNEKYIWCENFNIEGFCPCSPVRGSYDTLDEAKAAAQADYDERIRAAVILNEPQPPREMWAMLYLHDWDPPKEGQEHRWEPGKNVFPQIHNVYETWQEAETLRKRMSTPEKYWVCRVRMPAHDALALSRPQRATQ